MPEISIMTQLRFINTSRQKWLLGNKVLPSSYTTKFSLFLGSGQMQQSRTEKLMMPPIHTASITENQPWDYGQDLKETFIASSDNSNNFVPNSLETQLLMKRNEYVLYFQSFVSIQTSQPPSSSLTACQRKTIHVLSKSTHYNLCTYWLQWWFSG